MTNFFNPITGNQINVPYESILPLTLTVPITLTWPTIQADSPYPVAQNIIILSTTSAGNTLTFPDATEASLNYQTVIYNTTGVTITVLKNDGVTPLVNILTSQTVNVLLTDNTTSNGTWITYVAGAGTSSADAAALAGYGLKAITTTLNSNNLAPVVSTNFTVQLTDRASIKEWNGGAGAVTLQAGSVYGNGFWFGFKILPTGGSVTFTPPGGTTINGTTSYTLSPGNSANFYVDSANNWITAYDGIPAYFIPSVLNQNILPGQTAISLAPQQQSNVIQNFISTSGSLSATCTITYTSPIATGFFYISNLTSGGQNLIITDGTNNFTVTPNNSILLKSDGTRLYSGISEIQNLNIVNNITCLDSANRQVGFKSATTNSITTQIYTLPTNFPAANNGALVSTTAGAISFVDANLNAIWANRGGSNQTLANSGLTTLLFNVLQFQTAGGSYNTGTGTYTVPTDGIYQFNVMVDLGFTCTGNGLVQLIINTGASSFLYIVDNISTTLTEQSLMLSGLLQLTAATPITFQFLADTATFSLVQMKQGSSLTISKFTGS